jgi:hypothetical protein
LQGKRENQGGENKRKKMKKKDCQCQIKDQLSHVSLCQFKNNRKNQCLAIGRRCTYYQKSTYIATHVYMNNTRHSLFSY